MRAVRLEIDLVLLKDWVRGRGSTVRGLNRRREQGAVRGGGFKEEHRYHKHAAL